MPSKTSLWRLVPAFCAALVVLRLTVFKSAYTSDLTLGISVGILLALSILSFLTLKHKPS
jgi:hypothetical protein